MSIITAKTCKNCDNRSYYGPEDTLCPNCGLNPDKKKKASAKKKAAPKKVPMEVKEETPDTANE